MVTSYQKVKLDVTAYVWHSPENGELNVAYFNFTEFQSTEELTVKNDAILPELEQMLRSVTVYQAN